VRITIFSLNVGFVSVFKGNATCRHILSVLIENLLVKTGSAWFITHNTDKLKRSRHTKNENQGLT
jgi:hypothetical protein